MTHTAIWAAIDALADKNNMTTSRLAQISGMDVTSFNPSKRFTRGGKPRWPSIGSLLKILAATGTTLAEFVEMIPETTDMEHTTAPKAE